MMAIFNSKEILNAITKRVGNVVSKSEKKIFLELFDANQNIGVGTDSMGRTVLLLPGQSQVTSFETNFAVFDHWTNMTRAESDELVEGVALLTLKIEKNDSATIDAATAIFLGIIDLQKRFNRCGEAIWQMKNLFESGFKYQPSDENVTGLFGELLLILNSSNKNIAASSWHSEADDTYDFSNDRFRMDVKTTRSGFRHHHFSSSQIPGPSNCTTQIASVLLHTVEMGTTLEKIFDTLISELSSNLGEKISESIIKQLGTHPSLISKPQIDLESSIRSILLYNSEVIPCVDLDETIISANWLASLDNVTPNNLDPSKIFDSLKN